MLGALGLQVLELFLLTNMLCTTSAVPVLAGLLPGAWARAHVRGDGLLWSCLGSMAFVSVYGVQDQWDGAAPFWTNLGDGLRYAWMGNGYDWRYLAAALFSSAGAAASFACGSWALSRCGFSLRAMKGCTPKGGLATDVVDEEGGEHAGGGYSPSATSDSKGGKGGGYDDDDDDGFEVDAGESSRMLPEGSRLSHAAAAGEGGVELTRSPKSGSL